MMYDSWSHLLFIFHSSEWIVLGEKLTFFASFAGAFLSMCKVLVASPVWINQIKRWSCGKQPHLHWYSCWLCGSIVFLLIAYWIIVYFVDCPCLLSSVSVYFVNIKSLDNCCSYCLMKILFARNIAILSVLWKQIKQCAVFFSLFC